MAKAKVALKTVQKDSAPMNKERPPTTVKAAIGSIPKGEKRRKESLKGKK